MLCITRWFALAAQSGISCLLNQTQALTTVNNTVTGVTNQLPLNSVGTVLTNTVSCIVANVTSANLLGAAGCLSPLLNSALNTVNGLLDTINAALGGVVDVVLGLVGCAVKTLQDALGTGASILNSAVLCLRNFVSNITSPPVCKVCCTNRYWFVCPVERCNRVCCSRLTIR